MTLINQRTKTVIATQERILTTTREQARGLMFTKKKEFCLIFHFQNTKKISFHMWFVWYPIDIIFLDNDRRIIEMKERFLPFHTYTPKQPIKSAIELPKGSIQKGAIKIGDILSWS
jgi:uncharacterized membrane protein (UPF0127 family)